MKSLNAHVVGIPGAEDKEQCRRNIEKQKWSRIFKIDKGSRSVDYRLKKTNLRPDKFKENYARLSVETWEKS